MLTLPPYRLTLIIPECGMQFDWGRKGLVILPNWSYYKLQCQSPRHDLSTGLIVTCIFLRKPITLGLYLRPTSHEGIHAWYCESGQRHMAMEVILSKEVVTTILYLNSHGVQLPSK